MNTSTVPRGVRNITAKELILSSVRVFWQVLKLQGLARAFRVIPILFVLLKSVRGFAQYHVLECKHFGAARVDGTEVEERQYSSLDSARYQELGQWLRIALHKLGPAFIKVGQMLSTRADLLPLPAMQELAVLQEDLEPFSLKLAREIIIYELGAPPEILFRKFNPIPIAAASLSQAYHAVIFDGREVVVKVQRPDLANIITQDMQILEVIAQEANKLPGVRPHGDWEGVLQEFARTTLEEIDYIREGRNANTFRHNFSNFDHIFIPRIVWSLTSKRVLTIEYVSGAKITDTAALSNLGIRPRTITSIGTKFYLRQLLEDGFFHADPHPGNLRIMADGTIGVFDFGMVGHISDDLKQQLMNALFHVVHGEYRELIDDFADMGCLGKDCDRDALCRDLTPVLRARFAEGMSHIHFRKILFDFSELVYRYPFKLPVEFTYLMRALLMLEGIALTIDPNFNFVNASVPFIQRLMLRKTSVRELIFDKVFTDGKLSTATVRNLIMVLIQAMMSNGRNGHGAFPRKQQKLIDNQSPLDYT